MTVFITVWASAGLPVEALILEQASTARNLLGV
jgi:hypothetical protein